MLITCNETHFSQSFLFNGAALSKSGQLWHRAVLDRWRLKLKKTDIVTFRGKLFSLLHELLPSKALATNRCIILN